MDLVNFLMKALKYRGQHSSRITETRYEKYGAYELERNKLGLVDVYSTFVTTDFKYFMSFWHNFDSNVYIRGNITFSSYIHSNTTRLPY